tara:strand:- start:1526 stop:1774 length:249 start_codon:yes stop_codon:yes gene_type:complete
MKKNIQDRCSEVMTIRKKLEMCGLTAQNNEIKTFQNIMNQYIRDGNGISGKFRIENTDRILKYILPEKSINQCTVSLLYRPI